MWTVNPDPLSTLGFTLASWACAGHQDRQEEQPEGQNQATEEELSANRRLDEAGSEQHGK